MFLDLLTVIHERGKNTDGSNDEFSHIKDLSALFVNSDLLTHDRYWFKSDIIRLIANMCYNHKEHQHLVNLYLLIKLFMVLPSEGLRCKTQIFLFHYFSFEMDLCLMNKE